VRVIAAGEVAAADAHCSASLTTVSRDGGAMVCFNPTGEHLYVCDLKADGHHPGVEYSIDEAPTKQADYDLTANYCHDLNLSMSEHSHVTYWAINYEGAAELSISEPITASAAG